MVSPLQAFSVGMLVDVGLPSHVFKRLTNVFSHAVDEGILEEVAAPEDVLSADPVATRAWKCAMHNHSPSSPQHAHARARCAVSATLLFVVS